VVGVDADAAMIAEAERRAEQAGCRAWCHHQQADATALPLETAAFDACRSERLFQHLYTPALALAEMARVTKPGGWVVVGDADWGTLSIDTPEVEIERRLVRVATEREHNNGYAGRQLYRLFKQQQLTDLTVQSRPVQITSYALLRYLTSMDSVERDAVAAGLITQEELHRWQQSLEQTEAEGTFFAHANGVWVVGRNKEAASGE
jgi:ubiquinone/menaquinone biosynthesis C-methylase UbiE